MWPFKPKEKLKLPTFEEIARLAKLSRRYTCPPIHQETKMCVCMGCPQRGPCPIERSFACTGHCDQAFVKGCTVVGRMSDWVLKGDSDHQY